MNMEMPLDDLLRLPRELFYVTVQGRLVNDWSSLRRDDHFRVHLRVFGGKGGFGSLLRSFGSQFYKSTNQDMCRDLSGRRLKDVKEEERLKKYIGKAAEREREKQRKLEEKYKSLKRLEERKHEFNDVEYNRERERILEETEQALRAGLKAAEEDSSALTEAGPSKQTTTKRKHRDADITSSSSETSSDGPSSSGISTAKKPKKEIAGQIWLGIDGLNESDLENTDSEIEDEDVLALEGTGKEGQKSDSKCGKTPEMVISG